MNQLTDEQKILVEEEYSYALKVAGLVSKRLSRDVREYVGSALCLLVCSFKPELGSFHSLVAAQIYNRLMDEIRREDGRHFQKRLPGLRLESDLQNLPPGLELADIVEDEWEPTPLPPTWVWDYVKCLDPKLAHLITAYYRDGITQEDLGKELGVTASRISQLIKIAEQHLGRLIIEHAKPLPKEQKRRSCEVCGKLLPPQFGGGRPRKYHEQCGKRRRCQRCRKYLPLEKRKGARRKYHKECV